MAEEWSTLDDLARSPERQGAEPFNAEAVVDKSAKPTWGDLARYPILGTKAIGTGLIAGGRYVAELMGDNDKADYRRTIGAGAHRSTGETRENLTPVGRRRLEAAVTSGEFWEHPISSGIATALEMAPSLIATILPGGLLAGGMRAVAATAATGGALNAAQTVDDFYAKVGAFPDEKLQEESDFYRGLRTSMEEKDARARYNQEMLGLKPAVNFALGAAATAFGPAGAIANRGVIGAAEKGIASRVGLGAAEGGVGNAIQGAVADATTQSALMQGGVQKQFDISQLVEATLKPALMGGVMGATAGALTRGAPKTLKPDVRTADPKIEIVEPGAPNAEQTVALVSSQRPVPETPKIPDVAPADVVPHTDAAPAVPPEVAAASERVATPEIPQEVTPQEPIPARLVPPEVAAASERVAAPMEEGVRAPRVLEAQDDAAIETRRAAKVAQDEAAPQLVEAAPSKGKNWTKAQLAKREADATTAKTIFDEEAPLDGTAPATQAARAELHDRVTRIVERAEEAGIKLSAIKAYDGTSDHMVYLREAADLKKTLDKTGTPPARRDLHIATFLGRELSARGGDFSIMRAERKLEGDLAKKRIKSGVADTIAAPKEEPAVVRMDTDLARQEIELSNATPEKNAIETPIARVKSRGGTVRSIEAPTEASPVKLKTGKVEELQRAVAASPVRKVELTAAERAKYEIPKVTPKVAAIKERVAAAAAAVEKAPTEAQKEAGNYAKGHVSIQGLDITMETRRGGERKGTGADGRPWSVKMPDHYGYIKKTHGADGDRVDVYIGKHPDSKQVFLIDQHDHATQKFDEHKAMIGYKDATDAMAAYEKAFSDGKGFDRIGLIKPLTMDEFKSWLAHGDTTKPAAKIDDAKIMAHARDTSEVIHHENGPIKALHTTTVGEIVKGLNFDHLTGASKKLIPFLTGRLAAVTKDMKVHIVAPEEMAKFIGSEPHSGPLGIYVPDNARGEKGDYIAISSDRLRNSEDVAHTLIHEMTHGAMARAITNNPAHRATIRLLMNEVEQSLKSVGEVPKFAKYAFTNEHEFLAEAFSNPAFQQLLAETPLSKYSAERIGLGSKFKPTMWDYFVASVRKVLRGLGVPDGQFSALEGVLKVGRNVLDDVKHRQDPMDPANVQPHAMTAEAAKDRVRGIGTNTGGKVRAIKDTLSSTIMLGQRSKHILPGAEKAVELKAMMERDKSRIFEKEGGATIVRDLARLEREIGPEKFNEVATVGFEASNSNVNLGKGANNDHLGKDRRDTVQSKKRLPELQKRFDAMTPGAQDVLTRTAEFFRKNQNDINLQLIKNTLHAAGVDEPGLAERIHRDGLTEADKEKFRTNGVIKALDDLREHKELHGWYIPFRRYGDHVVNAYHRVDAPAHGLKISPDTVQFVDPKGGDKAAQRLADKFAADHDLTHIGTKKEWVDKNDPKKFLPEDDVDAVPAYQVKLQRQSTDFFESQAEAERAREHLFANKDTMGLEQVDGVRKRDDFVGKGADALAGHMQTVMQALEKQDRFQAMSGAEKAAVRQTINEAAVRVLGTTRLQASFQQRRNVAGYSQDLGRVTADYARASIGYLAKLRWQPRIDEAFKDLQKYTDAHKFESSDKTIRRDELMNELRKRIYGEEQASSQTGFGHAARRLLQISRLDKLAGVSFHVINSQEPWTTSLPVIGGRHGFISAARTLGETYNLIGARGGLMAGLKDTGRAFTKDNGFTDYLGMFKDAIGASPSVGGAKAARLKGVLDYLDNRGIFNDDAIFEVARYADPTKGALLRGLDRADLMANQVGNAVEKINRTVTALTAYELEFKRNGGSHEAAMHYAYEVTHDTMGDYSGWNASPLFKGNAAMLAMQFKKFAFKTYYLLGKTFQGTIAGDREAAKQFIGLMVTHGVVAGALGLPLEPFKVALLAANATGVTGFSWQDFELMVRVKAADVLGTKGGGMFSHGLTRGLGVDTSTRQGLDSLMTFGAPQDASKVKDLKAWLFDTVAGAPAGWMLDQIKSAQALAKGDLMKAAELSIPIKAVTDVVRAGTGMSPKLDAKGKVTRPAYTPFEAGVRAIGFTPATEAEHFEKRTQAANATKEQSTGRSGLINKWVVAKPADKSAALKATQDWNRSQPQALRIESKDLISAAQKRAKLGDTGNPVRTKQNAHILDKLSPVYGAP